MTTRPHTTTASRSPSPASRALALRNGRGGTAPGAVAVQLAEVKADVAAQHAWATTKQT